MTARDDRKLAEWITDPAGSPLAGWIGERQPGMFAELGEDGVAPLRDSVDVDGLIASLPVPADGWFHLVRGRSSNLPPSFRTSEGFVDLGEVTRAYAGGTTLLLTKLQRRVPLIGELCRSLEGNLLEGGFVPAQRVGANLYVTPRGSQGFDLHYDDHDVLIVQLAGEKHWSVYAEWIPSPIAPPSVPLRVEEVGEPLIERCLRPGDILYIPSGFPHQARAAQAVGSSHLTLSIHLATWLDLARTILTDHPPARRALRTAGLAEQAAEVLAPCADPALIAPAVEKLRARFVQGLDLLPAGVLGVRPPTDGLAPEAEVELRRGMLGSLATDGDDTVVLTVPGAAIRCSAVARPALEHILAKRRVTVGDLPGDLETEDRLHLVEALINYGVVHPVAR